MNLLPWRLIKLSVIFPLRDINLAVGEEGEGEVWEVFKRKLARSFPLLRCLCLLQETATSDVASPAQLRWARPKSIWVWSMHICLVATNTTRCWEAAAGRATCQLQGSNMPCVLFFSPYSSATGAFSPSPHPTPPGKFPSEHL